MLLSSDRSIVVAILIKPFLSTAAAAAAAGMYVLALPGRVLLIRIKTPSQHETRTVLVGYLGRPNRLADQPGELTIGRIAAFVGRECVLGIRLDARQRRAPLALRRLSSTLAQFGARHFRIDFRHGSPPKLTPLHYHGHNL